MHGDRDSVLFTAVPERQKRERLEAPPYTSFPVLLSSYLGALTRGQGPGDPQSPSTLPHLPPGHRNLCSPPRPQAPLIHSSFPSSSAARPFPLASRQHNGLATLRFHDTRPPPLLSITGSQHFHTVRPGTPQPLTLTAAGAQTQEAFICKLEPHPWEGDLEAAVLGGGGAGGGGVIHVCWRERFLPSNWPWARQQVVPPAWGRRGRGSRPGVPPWEP